MSTAGDYRNRLVIEKADTVQDEVGQPVPGWVVVCRPWASIMKPTGIQVVRADAEASVVKASIRIRYRTNVAAGMRALHGGKVYAIRAVLLDDQKREHVDLVCEVVSG